MKSLVLFCAFWISFSFSLISCSQESVEVVNNDQNGHPRILLLDGEKDQIKSLIANDDTWKKMHDAILAVCDVIITQPELERVMIGRRLLSTSRELLRRVFFLSYGYRMTGDMLYAHKAEREMLAVSQFSDLNPSHFLDVAEMTMGFQLVMTGCIPSTQRIPKVRSERRLFTKD